jgi:hypothetical protein
MVVVAITALDLGAIRAVSDHPNAVNDLLAEGALPMANVLAFGMLVGCRRLESRSFLVGFEAVGAVALAFYVASILSLSDRTSFGQIIVDGYLWLAGKLWPPGSSRTVSRVVIARSALSFWLTWPQLAFALVGGFLTRLTAPSRGAAPGGRRGDQGGASCERIG